MKVTVLNSYGYCFGVERAVNTALKALKEHKKAYTIGPIVNNPHTNAKLAGQGLITVKSINDIPDGEVFFYPSHGISREDMDLAGKKGLKVYSLICPFVISIEKTVKDWEARGYDIIIFGDPAHTEVKSYRSKLNNVQIVQNKEDIKHLKSFNKALFISQSTQNKERFYEIFSGVSKICEWSEFIGKFTICSAVYERQEWLIGNVKKFDFVLVVGGYGSSNTKKLYDISVSQNVACLHKEQWDEEIYEALSPRRSVAIVSGTSSPKSNVDDIIKELQKRVTENGSKITVSYAEC